MTPLAAAGTGGLAGLLGAALAHVLATLAERAGCGGWLGGPFGPRFFEVALYTGVFYAPIGAAAGRRPASAALAFGGTFFGLAVPLYVLTRYGGWGMPTGEPPTPQWRHAFVAVYFLAVWGTIAAIGADAARANARRGAAAAVLGSLAGYAALTAALRVLPGLARAPWHPGSFMPVPVNLLDGLLSGAGLCLALSLDRRLSLPRRTP
ncbi:MAG: hypothetical protein ACHQ2Z_06230 [Elusimicrobiota bacterium]